MGRKINSKVALLKPGGHTFNPSIWLDISDKFQPSYTVKQKRGKRTPRHGGTFMRLGSRDGRIAFLFFKFKANLGYIARPKKKIVFSFFKYQELGRLCGKLDVSKL